MSLSLSAPPFALPRLRLGLRPLVPWIVPVLVVLAWQLGCDAGWITRRTLPSPLGIAQAAWVLARSGELFHHAAISCERAFAGFAIGGALGLAFGLLNGMSPLAARLLDTTLQMLRNIPHLAIIPLVILWFGIGEEAKIFLVSIGVLFPVYINTYHGVRTIDPTLVEMARVYGLGPLALFWRIILPGALPSIFVGLRYGLGIMWLTLIVAETISASSGIGYMTMNAREFLQTDVVLLGIIIYALLGKLSDVVTKFCERAALAWHPSYARETRVAV